MPRSHACRSASPLQVFILREGDATSTAFDNQESGGASGDATEGCSPRGRTHARCSSIMRADSGLSEGAHRRRGSLAVAKDAFKEAVKDPDSVRGLECLEQPRQSSMRGLEGLLEKPSDRRRIAACDEGLRERELGCTAAYLLRCSPRSHSPSLVCVQVRRGVFRCFNALVNSVNPAGTLSSLFHAVDDTDGEEGAQGLFGGAASNLASAWLLTASGGFRGALF